MDYSFWMATISGILSVVAAILIMGDMVTCPPRGPNRPPPLQPAIFAPDNSGMNPGQMQISSSGSGQNIGQTNAPPLPTSQPPGSTPQMTRRNDDHPPTIDFPPISSTSKAPPPQQQQQQPGTFSYVARPPQV